MAVLGLYRRMLRHTALMEAMIAKLGVREQLAAKPDVAAVTQRAAMRCVTCGAAKACENWLAQTEAATHAPDFCRNTGLFERLTREIETETAHSIG